MILRPATLADLPALAALGRDSFVAAFAHLYRQRDLDAFLEAHKTAATYGSKLADPGTRIALAEVDGRLAGFCIIAQPSEFADHSDASNPVALQQLYCVQGQTGQGLGARMLEWAIAESLALNAGAMQLSVWSGNHGAQRFYARYGFAKIADIDFWVGGHRDDEFLLEKRLAQPVGQSAES